MIKDFDSWNEVKKDLDELPKPPLFREREIWWCSVGLNVGYEIFGKGEIFARPVLVIRKFSKYTFLGAPMTSKTKDNFFHYPFLFKGTQGAIIFDQLRTFDSRRLGNFVGKVSEQQFEGMKRVLKGLL